MSRSPAIFRQKRNQELPDHGRFVFHGEMTAIFQVVQFGVRNRIVQLVCPRNDLPPIDLTPDDLNRHLAEPGQAIRDPFRVPVVVVANLMLKETCLPDGAGDEVEIRVKRGVTQTTFVVHRREKPFPEMSPMLATRLANEHIEAFLHLFAGTARRPAVEADDIDQSQGSRPGRREHAESLCDGSTNLMRHDVRFIQPPNAPSILQALRPGRIPTCRIPDSKDAQTVRNPAGRTGAP